MLYEVITGASRGEPVHVDRERELGAGPVADLESGFTPSGRFAPWIPCSIVARVSLTSVPNENSAMTRAIELAETDCSYLISHGKVAASGSPDELSNTSSELVRQFMHGMADGPVAFHYAAPNYAEHLLGRDTE